MDDPFDPATMTPEERAREVAAILAAGYLRRRAIRVLAGPTPNPEGVPPGTAETPCSPENDLDEPGDQTPPCVPGERS